MAFFGERGIGVGSIDPSEPEVGYPARLRFDPSSFRFQIKGMGGSEDSWVPLSTKDALREIFDRFRGKEDKVFE